MNILSFAVLAALLQGVTSSPGSVEGLVVTAGTGQPVAGAEVALGPLVVPGVSAASKMVVPQEAVQTDGNGRFIFLNVPSGEYIIGVKTVGGKRLSMRRVAVTVGEGQQLRGVRVETLAGVIEGRILNRNGKPAKGVTVIALQPSFYEGSPVVNASFSGSGDFGGRAQTVTGSDGTYRIESLYPGIYYVGVGFTHPHPRFLPATCLPPDNIGAELPPAPNPLADMLIRNIRRRQTLTIPDVVYFPGTSTASAAQTIQVFEQAPARADFQLMSSAKPLRLKGEVVDGAGDRIKGASITLLPAAGVLHDSSNGMGRFCNVVARNGTFEMTNVIEGSYTLLATGEVGGSPFAGTTSISFTDDVKDIRIVAQPAAMVSGNIVLEPPADRVDFSSLSIQLVPALPRELPVLGASNRQQDVFSATPDVDGRFSLQGILPGRYRLQVSGLLAGRYLRSARLDQINVLAGGVIVASAPIEALEVVVASGGGSLEISVEDPIYKPVVPITVVLVPDANRADRRDLYRTASSSDPGQASQVRIEGIVPGDYRLFVWGDPVPDGAWMNEDFLRMYADRARPIEVRESSSQAIEITP